ncbi:RNA polymerase sigma factor [Granulicella cerasi]|uniref:RNA polymerase sigma factor n=1 Tax=Granulicella cerasi TaxID=741063 RepID=A0ABW1Z9G0_9BACT|nr:sigma-70 family RNA polymerase sigma factor [Granulicella cerasi]
MASTTLRASTLTLRLDNALTFAESTDAASIVTDEELGLRMQAGDETALRIIYERYANVVRRVVFRILHDDAEADDSVQNVFWDMYRGIHRFDPSKGSLRGWLMQYARHRALNQKKALKQRGFYDTAEVDAADILPASRRSLLTPEATLAVRQALTFLTDNQRTTLMMVFLEGKEMEDVAHHLGQQVSNVRHHYYRGMSKLREVLSEKVAGRDVA